MKSEIVKIEQSALRCVKVVRTIYLEVPEGCRDAQLLQRSVRESDHLLPEHFFVPVEGTEYLEPARFRILGVVQGEPDLSLFMEGVEP